MRLARIVLMLALCSPCALLAGCDTVGAVVLQATGNALVQLW